MIHFFLLETWSGKPSWNHTTTGASNSETSYAAISVQLSFIYYSIPAFDPPHLLGGVGSHCTETGDRLQFVASALLTDRRINFIY